MIKTILICERCRKKYEHFTRYKCNKKRFCKPCLDEKNHEKTRGKYVRK